MGGGQVIELLNQRKIGDCLRLYNGRLPILGAAGSLDCTELSEHHCKSFCLADEELRLGGADDPAFKVLHVDVLGGGAPH